MEKYAQYTSRYALADYQVTIHFPGIPSANIDEEWITIGGPGEDGKGSCVGEIKVTRKTDLWTTEGDPTGSWVHNKNLDKTGTVEINIRQVSNYVIKLMLYSNAYESASSSVKGLDITINPAIDGAPTTDFITCTDCMIQKVPDQDYTDTAKEQQWIFTCGQVKYSPVL